MTDFGVFIFPTDYSIQPIELAQEAEVAGFESIFFPEHTHIPTNRATPFLGGGDLPKEYWHTHDPLIALAGVAGATKTIRIGTGITLVSEHEPLAMAKQVASLDVISNGRLILGIGAGWNAEEMANHGVDFKDRWKVVRERVLAMRVLWSEAEPEFHGEFVDFDPVWSYPKPLQDGGPPILLGAQSKWAFDRVVEYCDGWMPRYVGRTLSSEGVAGLREGVEALRAAADRGGRSIDTIQRTLFGVPPDTGEQEIDEMINLGFHRILFRLPPEPSTNVLPLLESCARMAERFS